MTEPSYPNLHEDLALFREAVIRHSRVELAMSLYAVPALLDIAGFRQRTP